MGGRQNMLPPTEFVRKIRGGDYGKEQFISSYCFTRG